MDEDVLKVDEETIRKNKELIEKYPFLLPRNRWTDKVPDDYDYSYTELDDMPSGWRDAFGEQMCAEIADVLQEADFLEEYRITQIKEKWGYLHWYDAGAPEKISDKLNDIIRKYEDLSERMCIRCGKPATKISTGWISPWCDSCAKELENWGRFVDADEWSKKEEPDV